MDDLYRNRLASLLLGQQPAPATTNDFLSGHPLSSHVEDRRNQGLLSRLLSEYSPPSPPLESLLQPLDNLSTSAGVHDIEPLAFGIGREWGIGRLAQLMTNQWPEEPGHFRSGGQFYPGVSLNPDDYYNVTGLLPRK